MSVGYSLRHTARKGQDKGRVKGSEGTCGGPASIGLADISPSSPPPLSPKEPSVIPRVLPEFVVSWLSLQVGRPFTAKRPEEMPNQALDPRRA